jgi:peptidyl-prolyl cis-trans isomerase B (cyclophilin B)
VENGMIDIVLVFVLEVFLHRRFVMKNKFILIILAILLVMAMAGCGNQSQPKKQASQSHKTSQYPSDVKENPVVTITMENGKKIVVELYPKVAPNTVANFVSLVKKGFYNGLTFHRVIPGFMIQGGDPNGDGTGGPGYTIKGEFSANGVKNDLKHERGVISMARAQDPNSAGSQFFIMVGDAPQLDGQYAAFGKVTEGMDVVDEIVNVKRDDRDKPLVAQKMKTVVVDTKGYDYPAPVKQ